MRFFCTFLALTKLQVQQLFLYHLRDASVAMNMLPVQTKDFRMWCSSSTNWKDGHKTLNNKINTKGHDFIHFLVIPHLKAPMYYGFLHCLASLASHTNCRCTHINTACTNTIPICPCFGDTVMAFSWEQVLVGGHK